MGYIGCWYEMTGARAWAQIGAGKMCMYMRVLSQAVSQPCICLCTVGARGIFLLYVLYVAT
jgi:hypothetical protein